VSVSIVRLGSARLPEEGLRLGTVRHPPRGVPKVEHDSADWYDFWLPDLAPSAELLRASRQGDGIADFAAFAKKYRREMERPESARLLDLLALLSHRMDFSVGCYCADEARCHRSLLREMLTLRGAVLRARGEGAGTGPGNGAR